MKKFFTVVFLCFVCFAASFNNIFFTKLLAFGGCEEVSFYCSQKNQTEFANEIKNGEGYIYSVDVSDAKSDYSKLLGCYGFSAKFDILLFDKIMDTMQVVKTETLEGVQNFYGYVNGLTMFDFMDNKKVNIQVALTSNGVIVGSPLILGSY
ncbi:MAG: hypothetical protein IJF22_00660 [Clostridia bacterium]|nr:hypothetical protein [Clostridia bacterium]